jgi:hypothetical protein
MRWCDFYFCILFLSKKERPRQLALRESIENTFPFTRLRCCGITRVVPTSHNNKKSRGHCTRHGKERKSRNKSDNGIMPQLTWIQRVSNPLILVAEENKDLDEFTQLAKKLFKTLKPNSPPRQIIEAGKYYFLYARPPSLMLAANCLDRYLPAKV